MKAEIFWMDGELTAAQVAELISPEMEKLGYGKVFTETRTKYFEAQSGKLCHRIYVQTDDYFHSALSATMQLESLLHDCGMRGVRCINDRPVDVLLSTFEKSIKQVIRQLKGTRNVLGLRNQSLAEIRRSLENALDFESE